MAVAGNSLRCRSLSWLESLSSHSRLSRSEADFWQVPPLLVLATTPGTKTRKGELKRKWVCYHILILTFPAYPRRRREKPSRGVCRDGSVTLMYAPRSSATMDLVL